MIPCKNVKRRNPENVFSFNLVMYNSSGKEKKGKI